jgi:hypothetical protein
LISPSLKGQDRFGFGPGCGPHFTVHPWGSFASVLRHSLHGQGFGVKRVSQEPLQGFNLASASLLNCLCDTHLQPTNLKVGFLPIYGTPDHRLVGGRTNVCCHLLFLLSWFCKFFRRERPVGSLLPFRPGDVAVSSTRIHPITGWPSLFPTSSTRNFISFPYGQPAQRAKIRAYQVPLK